jgi:hypothetical protein
MMVVKVLPKSLDAKFWGLNHFAAKALHCKKVPKKGEFWVSRSAHGRFRRGVIVHEEVEAYLMDKKHFNYKKAHRIAEKFEKQIR